MSLYGEGSAEEMSGELELLEEYLSETTYVCDIIPSGDEVPVPVLMVELEEEEEEHPPLLLFFHYVVPDREEEDEDDIFGHTRYLQAMLSYPTVVERDEALLDVSLLCGTINQQLPLGSVFLTSDRRVNFRQVFVLDADFGMSREMFLESLYIMHYIVGQLDNAFAPLIAGECEFEEAVELYFTPRTAAVIED